MSIGKYPPLVSRLFLMGKNGSARRYPFRVRRRLCLIWCCNLVLSMGVGVGGGVTSCAAPEAPPPEYPSLGLVPSLARDAGATLTEPPLAPDAGTTAALEPVAQPSADAGVGHSPIR
ncbi:MAG: hypothetical protein OXU20_28125 [Myxococcales bacterium]|nr:hypothetical protein [Myxococcales bacterium]